MGVGGCGSCFDVFYFYFYFRFLFFFQIFDCVLFGVEPTNGLTHNVPAQRSVQRMRAGCFVVVEMLRSTCAVFFFFVQSACAHTQTHAHKFTEHFLCPGCTIFFVVVLVLCFTCFQLRKETVDLQLKILQIASFGVSGYGER